MHTLPHYEEDSGTQGGDTAPGGTIWGGTDNGPQGGGAQDTGTQGEAYPEGKTVYGDKETLLVNKKKHLPKQYIAIAAVVAAAAIGGGVLLSRPKPAPAPVSSVSAAAKTLIYAVKGKGGTLKTSEESGADSIKFEDGDELLQVTAVPDKGYKFDRWSDGYTRAERTDKPGEKTGTLYAIFVEDSASEEVKYTLRYRVSGEGGSVMAVDDATSGRQTGVIYNLSENADPVTVKAVADEGYHFVKWSDGVTDATRTDNDGESMHDVDVSAIFEKDADSDSTPSSKPKKVDPTPSPSLSPSPTPSPSPAPSPQPTPAPTPAPVAENWSMSAVSVGGGSVSITINSSSAVAVKAVLVYKANTSLQYSAGTIGNWASGTYTWTASRQGPPGDYTIRFYSASGQQMTSVDVTL